MRHKASASRRTQGPWRPGFVVVWLVVVVGGFVLAQSPSPLSASPSVLPAAAGASAAGVGDGAGRGTPVEPSVRPQGRAAPDLIIALYDDAGVTAAIDDFAPWLTGRDAFLLVTGNIDKPLDRAWLGRAAARLRKRYPRALLIAGTSGLKHVAQLAAHAPPGIDGIDYVYEPNQANEPEFSWNLAATERNLRAAASIVRRHHLLFFAQPTGMPLHAHRDRPRWDYAQLARSTHALIVQAQRYCRKSPSAFDQALTTLRDQFGVRRGSTLPYVQLTLEPVAPNGVAASSLARCAAAAHARGIPVALWFAAGQPQPALAFLQAFRKERPGTR